MIWAQWTIVGVAVLGAVVSVVLGIRLWRQAKAFLALLGKASGTLTEASDTLSQASATLQTAQSAAFARSRGEARDAAYTRTNPN